MLIDITSKSFLLNGRPGYMVAFLRGINYNFRGLVLGLKTPSLLFLGLVRVAVILVITLLAVGLVLVNYQELTNLMWTRPESAWLIWLWHVVSWLMALLLSGISAMVAFLLAQLLFSVVVMDIMSKITERKATGRTVAPSEITWLGNFVHLLKQEIPRATLPVFISLAAMLFGWLTPLSPVLTIVAPLIAVVFLAWDNTDLVPARRLEPFKKRFRFLRRQLGFHLGFGICFLVPGLNIVLLSFAPVGATLYYVEHIDTLERSKGAGGPAVNSAAEK
jgi:CysZ protein